MKELKKRESKFILRYEDLEIGDIVLESGKKLHSFAIQKYTNSHYSHAMICVENNSIIHAEKSGTFSLNPQRLLVDNDNDFKVLRLTNKLTDDDKYKIQVFLRTQIGSVYSVKDALLVVTNKNKNNSNNTYQFCSRLVAQAYNEINYKLVGNVDFCSPADIENSEYLYEVKGMARAANDKDIKFASRLDTIKENQRSMYDWLNKSRDLAWEKYSFQISTANDVDRFVLKHNAEDKIICKYIKESGYLENYQLEVENNPHMHNEQLFISTFKDSESICYTLSKELEIVLSPTKRHINNLKVAIQNYQDSSLEFYDLHIFLYKELLSVSMAKFITLFNVSKELISKGVNDTNLHLIMLYSQLYIKTLQGLGVERYNKKIGKGGPTLFRAELPQTLRNNR